MNTNAAPPYAPVMKGNRHTLPRPMAQPAERSKKPMRLFRLSRCFITLSSAETFRLTPPYPSRLCRADQNGRRVMTAWPSRVMRLPAISRSRASFPDGQRPCDSPAGKRNSLPALAGLGIQRRAERPSSGHDCQTLCRPCQRHSGPAELFFTASRAGCIRRRPRQDCSCRHMACAAPRPLAQHASAGRAA